MYKVKNTQKFNYEKKALILKGIMCLFIKPTKYI
jgi:hypothetical protein